MVLVCEHRSQRQPGWAPGRRSDLVSPFSFVLHSLGKPQHDHCGFSQHREMCSLTTTTLLSWAFPSRFGLSQTFTKVTVPFRTRPLFIHELVWLLPCFYISKERVFIHFYCHLLLFLATLLLATEKKEHWFYPEALHSFWLTDPVFICDLF